MGPSRPRFWCPAFRLGAFVAAWAVGFLLFLDLLRPAAASAREGSSEDGSEERRRRRFEKRRRQIDQFMRGRWHGAVLQDPVAVVVPLDPLPEKLSLVEFPSAFPLLLEAARDWDPPSPNVEALLALPERLLGSAAGLLGRASPGDGGVVDGLLTVREEPGRTSLLAQLGTTWLEREERWAAGLEESALIDTLEVDDLLDEQKKLLWDVLRRTYTARYRKRADDTLREAVFDPARWSAADLLVAPPLVAGYAMYRGFDRRFAIAGTRLRLVVEPLSDWRRDDLPAGLGLEWAPEGWPVALIATAGLDDGEFRMDFVGIGTSVGMVRRLLASDEPRRRD